MNYLIRIEPNLRFDVYKRKRGLLQKFIDLFYRGRDDQLLEDLKLKNKYSTTRHSLRVIPITNAKMIELSLFFQVFKIVCIHRFITLVREYNYLLHKLQIL